MLKYNFSKTWVSQIIESKVPFNIPNPFWASIFKLSFFPNVSFFFFYLIRGDLISSEFLIVYLSGLLWLNIGPFLIWYYDEILMPVFFYRVSDLIPQKRKLKKLAQKYDKIFSQKFWLISIPWTTLLVYVYINSLNIFLNNGGILNHKDIFYWAGFIGIIWMAILTSIGFWGVLTTVAIVKRIAQENFQIDPFHLDGFGGLSSVGHFTIGTSLLFSSGSLFLPATFQLISHNEIMKSYVYFGVILFSLFVLISFLYPTIVIHKKARFIREKILNQLRQKYIKLNKRLAISRNKKGNNILYLELFRIRNNYLDYKEVRLYCFEIDIFAKLVTSILLPFLFLTIQLYWEGRII